jgi:hypothetical protein
LTIKSSPEARQRRNLVADDDAVALGATGDDLLILGAAGARLIIAAAGAAAVDADAVALAGDAVALARAGRAVRSRGAVAGRVGAGAERQVGADGADGRGDVEVGNDILSILVIVDAGGGEAGAKLLLVELNDVAGGAGVDGLGSLDLGDRQGAALGDISRVAAGALGRLGAGGVAAGGRLGGRLGLGNIEDVELAAGGGLDGGLLAGVVRDVIAVDDVVVPVALAGLESGAGEAEGTLPRARLGGRLVLGKGELASVVVPRTEKVDRLDAG